MAKDLYSLIRYQGWQVDEKRRALGELLRIAESLENRMRQLHDDLKSEQNAAAASPEIAGVIYGSYAQSFIAERESLQESIEKAEEKVAAAREELREAYQEQKKYEMTQEAREKKEEEARKLLEQKELDEIGAEVHRQKSRR